MGILEQFVLATLPLVPTPVMRRLAGRYIAGEILPEAIEVLRKQAAAGHPGILDILGEDVKDEAEAREVCTHYKHAADAIHAHKLDANVSTKPTHLGLPLGEDLCLELYSELAAHTQKLGQFLRVEMEDHPTTDATLRIFEALRQKYDNVGIVLQSRLHRTLQDIAALADGPLDVRMVKGIYLEPEKIAHTEYEPIARAYVDCCRALFERGARVCFATHDEIMAEDLIGLVREFKVDSDHYEFQVLLGVREFLWEQWKSAGHQVRIYVPYGPEWRAYSQRRLRKNPKLLRAVMRNALPF